MKTSNPSSGELQDREIDGEAVYSIMAGMCEGLGCWSPWAIRLFGSGRCGGATYPAQLAELRKSPPHLLPGAWVMAPRAELRYDVAGALMRKATGAIVNSSRAILTAWKKQNVPGEEYAIAARNEAIPHAG